GAVQQLLGERVWPCGPQVFVLPLPDSHAYPELVVCRGYPTREAARPHRRKGYGPVEQRRNSGGTRRFPGPCQLVARLCLVTAGCALQYYGRQRILRWSSAAPLRLRRPMVCPAVRRRHEGHPVLKARTTVTIK